MTLEEAIKHAEEVAEEKEGQAWEAQLQEEYRTIKSCKECAEEHRQLAEWLKDYKRLLEQEPCEDCISRKGIQDYTAKYLSQYLYNDVREAIEDIDAYIGDMPSVQPKVKTGHWEQYGYYWEDKFKCSECGKEQPKILCGERIIGHWSDYCPNCGAKMEG